MACAAVGDTGSTWDAAWGAAGLANAPDATAAQYQADVTASGVTALVQPPGQPAPYDFGTYTAITLVGGGNSMAQIIGGASATDANTTGSVQRNSWIAAESGEYMLLVGGNFADNWNAGVPFNFTGDSHILVNGANVGNVIGGNYKDGLSASFTGNSYISVMSGNVRGAIVGAGVVTHNRDVQFAGDTHVFVYVPLADNSGPAVNLLPANAVLGGFGWATNTRKTQTLSGDTHVSVNLGAYSGASASFAKHIVGGGFNGSGANAQVIEGDTNVTVDLGAQSMASGVRVIGGHWVNAGTGRVEGTSNLSISGGGFADWVVGASWTDTAGTNTAHGGVRMLLSGGTFSGNVLGASRLAAGVAKAEVGDVQIEVSGSAALGSTLYGGYYINGTGTDAVEATLGDVAITFAGGEVSNIIGGSYLSRNNADVVVEQGNINIVLQGGVLTGNIHAAGQQTGSSSMRTESTSVSIGSAVQLAAGIAISGDYAGNNITSLVSGQRVLIFNDAATYADTAEVRFESFDEVRVATGGSVVMGELAATSSLLKSGGGSLALSAHSPLSELVISGGSLVSQSGIDAAGLTSLQMAAGTALSGVEGVLSAGGASGTTLNLALAEQNVGLGAAAVPIISGADLTLDITGPENLVLDLSADSVVDILEAHRTAGAVSWVTLTNGSLQMAESAYSAILPELSAYGVRVAGTSGGSILISGEAQDVYYVTADAATTNPHTVNTYPTLGMYAGVVIEGGESLELSLPGDEDAGTVAVVRNLTGGSASTLLLNNSTASGVASAELLQNTDTQMAGDILAGNATVLVKNGNASLTVGGNVQAPNVQVTQGLLLLNGTDNRLQSVNGAGQLTLASGSASAFSFDSDAEARILNIASLVVEDGASITLHSTGSQPLRHAEYVLGEVEHADLGALSLTLSGVPFLRVDAQRSFLAWKDGKLLLYAVESGHNPLQDIAESRNGRAGAHLLWEALPDGGADVAAAYRAAERLAEQGKYADADRLMSAVAGASYAAVGAALHEDMLQRLAAVRNRVVNMGLPECYEYEGLPYVNAWFQMDGGYSDLSSSGTDSGYSLGTWGGTVGLDADFNTSCTAGVAFSALYGDFDASAPDHLSGDLNRYYLSLYGKYRQGAWSHALVLSGGRAEADLQRRVHIPGAYTYATHSSSHGYAFGLLYELGYKFTADDSALSYLQPVFNVAYTHTRLGSFTEQGADAALHVGEQALNALVFGAGVRAQTLIGENSDNRPGTLQARALLKIHALDRHSEADVAFARSAARRSVISAEAGLLGCELGSSVCIPIGPDSAELYLDAAIELRSSCTDFSAAFGLRFRF